MKAAASPHSQTIVDFPRDQDGPVYFDDDESLIEQGSFDTRCYVILEGAIEIRQDGRTISREGPGSIVGELSLIDDGPASADVIATAPIVAVPISRQRFETYVQESPEFALVVMRVMAHRLRASGGKI